MSKARDLADFVAAGGQLADGVINVAEIGDLTATAAELNTLDGITADVTELNYVDGVTSAVQTQLDAKAVLDAAQTFTAQQTFGELKETVFTLGTSGTVALDPANGSIQSSATSGAITFTDSLEAGQTVVLHITGGDSNTITWPTMTWVTSGGNVAPTSTASDVFVFWKISTTLYGAYVGNFV